MGNKTVDPKLPQKTLGTQRVICIKPNSVSEVLQKSVWKYCDQDDFFDV